MSLKNEVDRRKRLPKDEKLRLKVKPTSRRAKINEIQLILSVTEFNWLDENGRKEKKSTKESG